MPQVGIYCRISIEDRFKSESDNSQSIKKTQAQQRLIEASTKFSELDRALAEEFIDCIQIGKPTDDGVREIHI